MSKRFRRPLLEGHRHARHPRGLCALRAQDLDRAQCRRCSRSTSTNASMPAGRSRRSSSPRPIRTPAANTPMRRSSRPSGCSLPRARRACRSSIRPATPARRAGPSFVAATKRNRPPVNPERLCHPAGIQAAGRRRGHHQAARQRVLRHAADRASDPARHPDADRLRREHLGLRARDRGRRLFARLHVVLVEECCFDRSLLSHKVNLFDMHHKYVRRDARRRGGGASRRPAR